MMRILKSSRLLALVMLTLAIAIPEGYLTVQQLAAEEQADSEFQVVQLLSKLFNLIKKNYLEIRMVHDDYARAGDETQRVQLRHKLQEKIGFVEGNSHEYEALMPKLRDEYPRLRPIVAAFHRDVSRINADIDGIKHKDGLIVPTPVPQDDYAQAAMQGSPGRASGALSDGAAAAPTEITESGTALIVPITLKIQADGGNTAPSPKKVVFDATPPADGRILAIVDGPNALVRRKVVTTDASGRASIQLRVDNVSGQPRIRRTVIPGDEETLCRFELAN